MCYCISETGLHKTDSKTNTAQPDKREWTDLRISGFVYGAHTNPDKTCGFVYGNSTGTGSNVTSGFVYGTPEKTIRTYGMGITNPDSTRKPDHKSEVNDKTSKSSIISGKDGSVTKKSSPSDKNTKINDKTSKSSVGEKDNSNKVFDKTSRSSILSGKLSGNTNNNAQISSSNPRFWGNSPGFKKFHNRNYVSILPDDVVVALQHTKQAEMLRQGSGNAL